MSGARHIVLVGPMGSGKTTVGRAVAAWLGRPFLDNDVLLGGSAAAVARAEGIDTLHDWEAEVVMAAIEQPEPAVVAAAASVIESSIVRDALAGHLVVRLTADPATLAARVDGGAPRPHLDDDPAVRRASWYEAVADLTIDTAATTVDEATEQIVAVTRTPDLGDRR